MWFIKLSAFSLVVPLIIGLSCSLKSKNKWLLFFLVFALISTVVTVWFASAGINTVVSNYVYLPISFVFIVLSIDKNVRRKYLVIAFLLVSFSSCFEVWMNGPLSFPIYTVIISYIPIILLAIRNNFSIIQSNLEATFRIEKDGHFWINNSFLLYFSGTLVFFLFSKHLQNHYPDLLLSLWYINSVLNIIIYSIMSYGIWLLGKKQN